MSGNQPGNIIGYGVIPPFLPAMIDFKGTAGLHQGQDGQNRNPQNRFSRHRGVFSGSL
jgi:hypothetical protein